MSYSIVVLTASGAFWCRTFSDFDEALHYGVGVAAAPWVVGVNSFSDVIIGV
jgi:hypothetical protein